MEHRTPAEAGHSASLEHSQFFDAAEDPGRTYLYTVAGLAPASTQRPRVQADSAQAECAGTNGNLAACVGDDASGWLLDLVMAHRTQAVYLGDDDGTGQLTGGCWMP
ncbi:MAG: hypothetical protein H6592_12595 [Flavobacteriales bacterium]|nr:hypothetical protein [Flavobacteriales bacterium]